MMTSTQMCTGLLLPLILTNQRSSRRTRNLDEVGCEITLELEGASHSNFACPRRMADLENEISPLKVANSKDLYETEADLNVNRELLKNSA